MSLGKTFLICPVRGKNPNQYKDFVDDLERKGWEVYWPPRDTNQSDDTGLRICDDNLQAIKDADIIHFVWDGKSQGCLFDLGMAFALGKLVVPLQTPNVTSGQKSFQSMIWRHYQESFLKVINQ